MNSISNMWQNAKIFFPGDQIPDPLPYNHLYLFVGARYLGDFHNRYAAVKDLLENTDGNQVRNRRWRDFEWTAVPSSWVDKLIVSGINVMRETPGFGPIINGNIINGTMLRPAELMSFAEVLRNVRVRLASLWEIFLCGQLPDADSTALVHHVYSSVVDTLEECSRQKYLLPFRYSAGYQKDKSYTVTVHIGSEHFVLNVDAFEPSVTIKITPTLMQLLENVVGMENVGFGDIVVDRERAAHCHHSMTPEDIMRMSIARTFTVRYEFEVLPE